MRYLRHLLVAGLIAAVAASYSHAEEKDRIPLPAPSHRKVISTSIDYTVPAPDRYPVNLRWDRADAPLIKTEVYSRCDACEYDRFNPAWESVDIAVDRVTLHMPAGRWHFMLRQYPAANGSSPIDSNEAERLVISPPKRFGIVGIGGHVTIDDKASTWKPYRIPDDYVFLSGSGPTR